MSLAYYKRDRKYQERMLPSGFFEGYTYGSLHKCWLGFIISKEKYEWDKLEMYAKRIRKLERELGIEVTDFSNWI